MSDFLRTFRAHNNERARQCFVHDTSPVWWTNAIAGEAGEACNLTKKMTRGGMAQLDMEQMRQAEHDLIIELADIVTYCDLLLAYYGVDMEDILKVKFNIVSKRCGYPSML